MCVYVCVCLCVCACVCVCVCACVCVNTRKSGHISGAAAPFDGVLQDVAAIAGWNTVSLVDLVDGTLLAEHSIPSVPTQPLAYGDFDNDGINDIIVTCKKG